MKKSVLVSLLISIIAPFALSGCIAAIGNDHPPRNNVTLGQQLIDLKRARDSGAITEGEYQAQRAKFLAPRQ